MKLRVLVGCERSRIVADAFEELGHEGWSCDLLPSDRPSNKHIRGDVREVLETGVWDLFVVLHPPCTRLCNSGVRWITGEPPEGKTQVDMLRELAEGARFFGDMLNAKVPHRAVENPVMHKYAKALIEGFRKHSQSVQPWQFGFDEDGPDNEKKRTCWWLNELPKLVPDGTLDGTTARDSVHSASPGVDRGHRRSTFFPGMARALAEQWAGHVVCRAKTYA